MGNISIDYDCGHYSVLTGHNIYIDGIRSLYLCPDCYKKALKQFLGELVEKLFGGK